MKILQLGKYWDFKGGIETQFRNLCNNLADKVDLKIVHSSTGSKTERFGNRYSLASYWTVLSTPISPSLVKHITDSDIIHLHLPNPAAELAYLVARPKGKLVVSYHSDIVRQKKAFLLYKPILNCILKKASAIIVAPDERIRYSEAIQKEMHSDSLWNKH
jgi:rhamnosyl/mannosyltransferase